MKVQTFEGGHFTSTKKKIIRKLQSVTGKYSINTILSIGSILWLTHVLTLWTIFILKNVKHYIRVSIRNTQRIKYLLLRMFFALLTIALEEDSIDWLGVKDLTWNFNLSKINLWDNATTKSYRETMWLN